MTLIKSETISSHQKSSKMKKIAFPDNHKFHDELNAIIKDDNGLYAYDNFHKMYKVNWILKNTSK